MQTNNSMPQKDYDPRWFIWTIVFLVVTGVSLVAFITLSDSGTEGYQDLRVKKQLSQKQ